MKKRTKTILIVSFIALIIIGLFIFTERQSFLQIPQAPPQEKSFSFDGIEGIATSTYFGELKSSGNIDFQVAKVGFCNDNDGEVDISNSLIDGTELILRSSMNARGQGGCSGNGIKSNFEIPYNGELSIDVKVSASESETECSLSRVEVIINGVKNSFVASRLDDGRSCDYQNGPDPLIENKIFEIKEDDKIEISTFTQVGYTGSANAELKLNFEKEETPVIIPDPDCIQNIDCIEGCEGIPTCSEGICVCEIIIDPVTGDPIIQPIKQKLNPLNLILPLIILSLLVFIGFKLIRRKK